MFSNTTIDYGVAAAIIVSKMSITYPPSPEGIEEMAKVWRDVCEKLMSMSAAGTHGRR